MATLLVFLFTDAVVAPKTLKAALKKGLAGSFNRITVDGDTSTNDCVLVLAGGTAGHPAVAEFHSPAGEMFSSLLQTVMADLAAQVVRDGEGAAHVFKVIIEGAATPAEAVKAARTVALSPLVKTAVAGTDANWGRIYGRPGPGPGLNWTPTAWTSFRTTSGRPARVGRRSKSRRGCQGPDGHRHF